MVDLYKKKKSLEIQIQSLKDQIWNDIGRLVGLKQDLKATELNIMELKRIVSKKK